jgi:alpha-beta hydrolase superfamily lysophospholipase
MATVVSTSGNPVNSNHLARDRVSCVILSSPALAVVVTGRVNRVLAPLAGIVNKIPGMRMMTKANGIPGSALTSCEEEQKSLLADPLVHNLVSFGVAEDFLHLGSKLGAALRRDRSRELVANRLPILVVYGEKDPIIDKRGGTLFAEAAEDRGLVKTVVIPNALHEPFNEVEPMRSAFYKELGAFLDNHLS